MQLLLKFLFFSLIKRTGTKSHRYLATMVRFKLSCTYHGFPATMEAFHPH
ncbi:hypothetical protein IC582_015544 [Cucumis melo]